MTALSFKTTQILSPGGVTRLKIDGAVLYLGRLLKDGFHNVERVRLTDYRMLFPALRRAKIRGRMDGKRVRRPVEIRLRSGSRRVKLGPLLRRGAFFEADSRASGL